MRFTRRFGQHIAFHRLAQLIFRYLQLPGGLHVPRCRAEVARQAQSSACRYVTLLIDEVVYACGRYAKCQSQFMGGHAERGQELLAENSQDGLVEADFYLPRL